LTSHRQEDGALNSTLDTTKNAVVFELILKASENRKISSQGFQETTKVDPEIHKNLFMWRIDFRNTFLAKTSNAESQALKFRFRNRQKMFWKQARKKGNVKRLKVKKLTYTGSREPKNRWKSGSGPPRVHPAAPMVLQIGPEVPKLPPWCSRDAQIAPRISKWRHQAP
jgi:hypothetical protein